jgi:hypothetical protein
MALFERFHLSQEEAEARLKRALTGDPTRGEIGLLAALNANKYDDVQGHLARDTTLCRPPRPRRRAHAEGPGPMGDPQGLVRDVASTRVG